MITPLQPNLIYPIFGEFYGKKLIGWLNPCNNCNNSFCAAVNACTASTPFTIGVDLECTGQGEMQVTLTATYNVSITGITALRYLASSTDPSLAPTITNDNFALETLPSIVAGTTYTTSFTAGSGNGSTRYIIATDSHGNYSNVVPVVIPAC